MGPKEECRLCGSKEDLDFYCGGPVDCLCDKCKTIVLKWEEARKNHEKWWRAERKKARSTSLKRESGG